MFGLPWVLMSFLVGEVLYAGFTSRMRFGDQDREWLGRAAGYFLSTSLVSLAFSAIVFFGPNLWDQRHAVLAAAAGSGLLSIGGGLSPLSIAAGSGKGKERFPLTRLISLLSLLFLICGLVLLSEAVRVLVESQLRNPSIPVPQVLLLAGLVAGLLGISNLAALLVNVNTFSLHAMYRNRLVKTFLGASNADAAARNRFNGFSDADNIPLAQLRRSRPAAAAGLPDNPYGPAGPNLFPVINMTLNVLASRNLAWQERKAEPFVATPLFAGGDRVGYRPTAEFGGGLTLGTAMAVSGAAASPNWGYHSEPLTSFLMMLFNVRLGLWLGNPRHDNTWRSWGPRSSLRLFIQEALGQTSDDRSYVYLSDGGHFDNLGLYEMIRRRCRTIVISDAGADYGVHLEDLGNALRKISIDMGVTINFKTLGFRPRTPPGQTPEPPGLYCAIGDIEYPEASRKGILIYIKPSFYGREEPADVRAFAAANAKFPHESTLNQWFTESQFESYRSLGAYVIDAICGGESRNIPLTRFIQLSREYIARHSEDGGVLG
jgi:hypothetical protein